MTTVLVKREDGDAFLQVVVYHDDGSHSEGGRKLSPDEMVDGKRVRDWPVGVHAIQNVLRGVNRFTDWGENPPEVSNE